MAACDGMTFRGVSRSAWGAIKQAAASYGIGGRDTGSATVQGYAFSWSYNEAAKTLHIRCDDSPSLVPCSAINARLEAEVQKVIVAANGEGGESGPVLYAGSTDDASTLS